LKLLHNGEANYFKMGKRYQHFVEIYLTVEIDMMKILDFFEEKLNYNTNIFEYSYSYLDFYVLYRTHSEIEIEIYFETRYTVGKFMLNFTCFTSQTVHSNFLY